MLLQYIFPAGEGFSILVTNVALFAFKPSYSVAGLQSCISPGNNISVISKAMH